MFRRDIVYMCCYYTRVLYHRNSRKRPYCVFLPVHKLADLHNLQMLVSYQTRIGCLHMFYSRRWNKTLLGNWNIYFQLV